MAPPPLVAGVLAAVLLLIAGYCATRLVAARWWRRSTDHGVDVMHTVMGVAMAGTLVPRPSLLQARAWAVLFTAGTVWFGWRTLRDRRRHRDAGRAAAARPGQDGHHGAHVLSCAAMVCMLAAGPGLRTPIAVGRGALPVLALVLAVAVAVSVVVSTDRLSVLRPVPVHVTPGHVTRGQIARGHVTPGQAVVSGATPARDGPLPDGSHRAGAGQASPAQADPIAPASPHTPAPATGARPVLCPRLAASCQIMMGVAMAYMLILML